MIHLDKDRRAVETRQVVHIISDYILTYHSYKDSELKTPSQTGCKQIPSLEKTNYVTMLIWQIHLLCRVSCRFGHDNYKSTALLDLFYSDGELNNPTVQLIEMKEIIEAWSIKHKCCYSSNNM